MAGYQQSVYSDSRYPSESAPQSTEFDPPLPPDAQAQYRPGETWQEYYRRHGLPIDDGRVEATDAAGSRNSKRKQRQPDAAGVETQQEPLNATTEDDWLMGPPEQIIAEAPPVDERTIAAIQGAPWFERLKASVLFDDESVEKWLSEKYGQESVFRDVDDGLYFLPPDESKKPKDSQVWVRFDPDGLDSGDFVEFVPGVAAGILASVGVAIAAPASVPAMMGAAALGGAAAEAGTQAIGANISDESHVPLSERAGRVAFSGAMEGLVPGASAALGAGGRVLRKGAERLGRGAAKAIFESSPDIAETAARRGAMQRTGMNFTVGQETANPRALATEHVLRQGIFSSGISKPADSARSEQLYELAKDLVTKLHSEGGTEGAEAAIRAHKMRLAWLDKVRKDDFSLMFDAARRVAGGRKVVRTDEVKKALREVLRDESAHAGTAQSGEIKREIRRTLRGLRGKHVTVDQMKNSMSAWTRLTHDPRDFSARIESPMVGRGISVKVMNALRKDLDNTINADYGKGSSEIFSEIELLNAERETLSEQAKDTAARIYSPMVVGRGVYDREVAKLAGLRKQQSALNERLEDAYTRLDASSKAQEASSLLKQARDNYATNSRAVEEVIDNPLEAYGKDPEKVVSSILSGRDNTKRTKAIMKFLDEFSPDAANRLRARVVERLMYKTANVASSSLDDVNMSADKMATALINNRAQIEALLEGNPQGLRAMKDVVKTAQILKDRGPIIGSQTEQSQVINAIFGIGSASVLGTSFALNRQDPEEFAKDVGLLAAAVLNARMVSRYLFRPKEATALSRLMRIARIKKPGPKAMAAMRQSLATLGRAYAGYKASEAEDTRDADFDIPENLRRPLMMDRSQ